LAGGAERRAASGPSFGPRRRFLFALARLSFLFMIGGAERIDVKSAVIGEHPQVIIAPPDHPLAKQRSISPREIAKQTILMREVGSGTRLLAAVPGPTWNRAPHRHRMMPAASSLRDFLVAEGRRFLPNLKHGRRGGKTPAARGNHSAKRK
jgi:DNA-binding transcriptional LysR family regulator